MRSIPRLTRWLLSLAIFFLILMSLLRLGTYLVFKSGYASFTGTLPAFWLGFRYDARVVGVVVLLILLIGSFRLLDPFYSKTSKRLWLSFASLFAVILILFYVFDYFNFRYLSQRLNGSALTFLEDAKVSAGMIWQTYPILPIFVGVAIATGLLVLFINYSYKKARLYTPVLNMGSRVTWFIILFFACAFAIFGRAGQYPLRWSDAFNLGGDFKANLALNPFQSFFSSLSFRTSAYDKARVKRFYPIVASYLEVDHPDSSTLNFARTVVKSNTGLKAKPNIILVICESFSAYKSSMWGNPLNTTPFFNALSGQGTFFDNCFTPHFGTARGVWATITGIPDVELVKTASRNPAMVDQHTIINNFEGYSKFYFLGGSTSWANIRGLLTNNIKDLKVFEEGSYNVPKVDVWGISDKNLFLQADKILSREKKPFFAIIQTADNHRPYTISEEDLKEFIKVDLPQDTLKKYGFQSNEELNAFRYTDFGFKKFMDAAARSPYYDNTIFVFVGDHGISGNAESMFPRAWTDNGLTFYHVPLLFFSPKYIVPQRLHKVASQVDILPTLAGIVNITYTNTTMGKDLLRNGRDTNVNDHIAFIMDHNNNNIGIIKGNYYYNRQPSGEKEDIEWANFLENETGQAGDSLKNAYRDITTAWFETAKYMLLNNKKKGKK